jgi:Kef-type K+ transport system membrane component KefB
MEILFVLLILLVITRTFGEVVARFGQPPLVGELLSGIMLGIVIQLLPDLFPIMKNINQNEVFKAITDLGIFFLMLLAGMEMQPRELAQSTKRSLIVALGGMMLPFMAGVGLGWIFLPRSQFFLAQVLFTGTALAITAVPVAVKVLMDLDKLDSQPGRIVVSSAIIDDILSLLLLAVLIALIRTGTFPSMVDLLTLSGQVVLFFAIAIGIGLLLLPRLEKLVKISVTEEFEFSSLLMVALAFAVFAETLQIHFILGAFIAGLFFTKRTLDPQIFEGVKNRVSGITTGFLAPIFFASIGMRLDLSAIEAIPLFLLLLIAAAVLGKLLGAGVPVFWMTRNWKEALIVGSSMNARGAVGLIIADIAMRQGLFSHPEPVPAIIASLFSAIVIMAVITTLLTPFALRWVIFNLHSKK